MNTDQCCIRLLPQRLPPLQHLHHQLGHLGKKSSGISSENLIVVFKFFLNSNLRIHFLFALFIFVHSYCICCCWYPHHVYHLHLIINILNFLSLTFPLQRITCLGLESILLAPRSLLRLEIPSKLRPTFDILSLISAEFVEILCAR